MLVTRKTKDTYEVAYYLMKGGSILDVEMTILDEIQSKKRGYGRQWVISIEVDSFWQGHWSSGRAIGNLKQFTLSRHNAKKRINRILSKKYENRNS